MAFKRLLLTALFLAVAASVANAYTLIMRDGRRVEIPNDFTVTHSTLTYEVGSGIQITIQLASVDISATERANGQPWGSFLLKASATQKADPAVQKRAAANRSITNQDLEPYKRTRIQSEIAYEKRRKELGLGSPEQRRQAFAAIEERTREQLLGMRSRDEASEEYWRSRASALRTEIATNQAQLDFVRGRLNEISSATSFGGLSTTSPFSTVVTPFPNPLTQNILAPSNPFGRFNRFRGRGRYNPFGYGNVFGAPLQSYDYTYERAELTNQLNELEMQRAGMRVRWQELEEAARRAGAYPGWLRP